MPTTTWPLTSRLTWPLTGPLDLSNKRLQPSFALDFLSGVLDSRVTLTRPSGRTRWNSSGVLETLGNNVPAFDYDPLTLAIKGLLIEEQRTNSIRNSTMVGAVAGTPGTLPTNWSVFTSLTGLTRQVVGTGTEAGVSYIDVRLSGTPSAAGNYFLQFDTNTAVAALNGQTWTSSLFNKLASGSLSGVTEIRLATSQRDGSGNDLGSAYNVFAPSATMTRSTHTLTNSSASTAFELTYVQFVLSGAAIDFTIRLGLPQLEQGAFATSPIPTTTAAATRAADVALVSPLAAWFNANEGTLVAKVRWGGLAASSFPGLGFRGAGLEAIGFFANQATGQSVALVRDAAQVSQAQMTIQGAGVVPGARSAMVLAYKANDFAACANGGTVLTDTSGTVPTMNRLQAYNLDNSLNGWLEVLSYYPIRLPNATVQALAA
jgi:hypothetical protein